MNRNACIGLLFAGLSFATPALAEDCSLKLLTSLDMMPTDEPRILVPASINGAQVQLLIDTGSGLSNVSEKAVDTLKLKREVTNWQVYDLYGNMSQQFVVLHTLQLGPLKADHLHLMIWPNPGLSSDGLIGGDILSNYDIELNFAAHKVNFFSQDHCEGKVVYWPAKAGTVVPFAMNPRESDADIHVPVTIDDKHFKAIIDTGAPVTTMSATVAEETFGINTASPGVERSSGDQAFGYVFHTLSFGGINVANPRVTIIPDLMGTTNRHDSIVRGSMTAREAEPQLIIGMNILSHLHLYIAYGEEKLYITPSDQPVATAEH